MYQVMINGKTEYSAENTDPKDFENVKVYVSDPWYAPFTSEYGYLENFKYSRPFEGKKITENNGVHLVSAPNHTLPHPNAPNRTHLPGAFRSIISHARVHFL